VTVFQFPQLFVLSSPVEDQRDLTQAPLTVEDDLNVLRTLLRRLRGRPTSEAGEAPFLVHFGSVGGAPGPDLLHFWYAGTNPAGEAVYRMKVGRPSGNDDGVDFCPQYPFDGQPRTVVPTQTRGASLTVTSTWTLSPVTTQVPTSTVTVGPLTPGYTFQPRTT
jgi:hypothetical protein